MVDLSLAPSDCASERVGPPAANAAGERSATFRRARLGELELGFDSVTSLGSPVAAVTRSLVVTESKRAAAPATGATECDERFAGAQPARRSDRVEDPRLRGTQARLVSFVGMERSDFAAARDEVAGGDAPAASSHLQGRRRFCF